MLPRRPSPDQANADYQQAEALLAQDMPVIPMWYGKAVAGWSTKVDNVKVTPFGTFDLHGRHRQVTPVGGGAP